MQIFEWQGAKLKLERYPTTGNKSLRPWSAAEELVLEEGKKVGWSRNTLIFHDQFGFFSVALAKYAPQTILTHFSQKEAIQKNIITNTYTKKQDPTLLTPLSKKVSACKLAVLRVPKSMDLFRHYLWMASKALEPDGVALAGFMTRYFTPQMLEIANEYFGIVEQSLAKKKARVLILKAPKPSEAPVQINEVAHTNGAVLKQYAGVFSAGKIDIASQFFMQNWVLPKSANRILDLASGNGILAFELRRKLPESEIHCIDDYMLAVESSKLNVPTATSHWAHDMSGFGDKTFDLVVCNPPFHFEHENTIDIALEMFASVAQRLQPTGSFQLVANLHLNYSTHLRKIFTSVVQIAKNDKFEILSCTKT